MRFLALALAALLGLAPLAALAAPVPELGLAPPPWAQRKWHPAPPKERPVYVYASPQQAAIIPPLPGENYIDYMRRGRRMIQQATLLTTHAGSSGGAAGGGGGACVGTQYYAGSGGNDGADGLTVGTRWATISKVNTGPAAKFGANSCLTLTSNLAGNFTFSTFSNLAAGASLASPFTVDCAGFTVTSTTGGALAAVVHVNNAPGIVVQNCTMRNGNGAGNLSPQFGFYAEGVVNFKLLNSNLGGFFTNQTGDASASVRDVSSGTGIIQANTIGGLTGATSADDQGILVEGAVGTKTVQGNVVQNIGSRRLDNVLGGFIGNGIEIDNTNAAGTTTVVQFNFVISTGGNTNGCGGPSGILLNNSDSVTTQYNEVTKTEPSNQTLPTASAGVFPCDWDGIDMDGGMTNSIVQGNYTHDNFGPGLLAWMGDRSDAWLHNTYRYNISEHDYYSGYNNSFWAAWELSQTGSAANDVRFYGNLAYQNSSSPGTAVLAITGSNGNTFNAASIFANNILAVTSGNIFIECNTGSLTNLTFKSNAYWLPNGGTFSAGSGCPGGAKTSLAAWQAVAPGGDTGAITTNPNWAGPVPFVGNCSWTPSALIGQAPCPAGFKLTASSGAYIGTGTDLRAAPYNLNIGTKDYWGNFVPNGTGTGINIGPDGGIH